MLRSRFIDAEHLFLGLCKIEDILSLEKGAIPDLSDQDWDQACAEVEEFREALINAGLDPKISRRRLRKILYDADMEKGTFLGHLTKRCWEVITLAEIIRTEEREPFITLKHLMRAILSQQSEHLDRLFHELSIDKEALLRELSSTGKKLGKTLKVAIKDTKAGEVESKPPLELEESKTPFLDKFGRDLTQLAREGKLDPVIGRKEEIKKVARILTQKRKNNPLIVGDAGVGKTAVVIGLAQKIAEPNAHPRIRNLRIIEISMGSLVAGTKYRGEFEQRLETLIKEASSDPNIVIFIDEIHTMIGAGSGGEAMDASNILKPALARGEIRCIGATTIKEYRRYIERDPALARRFQVVWVDEPTKEETIQILKGLRPKFEEHYRMRIPDEVIEKAVEFSMRYLTDFRLPDKAIDIIDQACARKFLRTFSPTSSEEPKELGIEDVAKVVSERARVPIESLTVEESKRLLKMEEILGRRVMGQEKAIKEVAETIRAAKAGLRDPRKPLAVFLFLGATGTGKTELAKAIAEFLFYDESKLITFDMSEYQEKHTVAKLIGAPPGYIGYEEEGQLTSKVRTNPYSVILFDEIEKAHPNIFDIFLQIFDEGRLTDSHGRKVNFSEAIIIMTSNLGSSLRTIRRPIGVDVEKEVETKEKSKRHIGVEIEEQAEDVSKKWRAYEEQIYQAISKAFRPEFLNRIHKKIIFYPLERETVRKILVEKILKRFNQCLKSKGIELVLSDSAVEFLIDKGYDVTYGAREMQRTFESYVSEPLSQMILRGEVKPGQVVTASATSEGIIFEVSTT
ncbi:MAG: ATP-dependent Clp protease ATP-binding subunit ClpC [Thermoproteota archaeon]|nr:MAG: ATP-dependent Clp protease ATP-binding subunit ClpC [Candidatus Korarchaeota archaeon]